MGNHIEKVCIVDGIDDKRCLAISTYSGSRSIPTKWKPSDFAASKVVPLPAKGSKIRPFGGQINFTRYFMRDVGFVVGWMFPSPLSDLLAFAK